MNGRQWLAVLGAWWLSLAAQGACQAHLSDTTLDFGPLHPPPMGEAWRSPTRTLNLSVACEPGEQPGFYVRGQFKGTQWAFGQGGLRVSVGEARLDGQPVTLLRRAGRAEASVGSGLTLAPDQVWVAGVPGRLLQVQLFIEATLPAQAWQARDAYQAYGELSVHAL